MVPNIEKDYILLLGIVCYVRNMMGPRQELACSLQVE